MAIDSGNKGRPRRALVVDDEAAVVAIVSRTLQRDGWSSLGASSAEEAFDLLKTGAFDVILLDVELPGMTGFQALGRISEITQAPVVLMSGHADEEFLKDALLLGAKGLLRKPFKLDELATYISSL